MGLEYFEGTMILTLCLSVLVGLEIESAKHAQNSDQIGMRRANFGFPNLQGTAQELFGFFELALVNIYRSQIVENSSGVELHFQPHDHLQHVLEKSFRLLILAASVINDSETVDD